MAEIASPIGQGRTLIHVLKAVLVALAVLAPAGAAAAGRPLYVYNFGGLEKMPPDERVALVDRTGYAGLVLGIERPADLAELPALLARCASPSGPRILAVFIRHDFIDPEKEIARRKAVVRLIAGHDIALWVILGNRRPGITAEEAGAALLATAQDARAHGVPVALYPHSSCFVSSAEDALAFLEDLACPEVSIVLHLCHELRARNGARLAEVVRNVGSRVSAISISGAATEVDFSTPRTRDHTTIQPLHESAFDWAAFVAAVDAAGLQVPVSFITFKIAAPPEDYLPRSLAAWRRATGS